MSIDRSLHHYPPAKPPVDGLAPGRRFKREWLPHPVDYYHRHGIKLRGTGSWRDALCPFHHDSNPSLRVRLETGAFRCMACGARGGDIVDFHRLSHGFSFAEAAKALGAWG